jgi:hypothetical protein
MLLSSPRLAVVARERKGMAPPSSFLGLFVFFWWCAAVASCSFFQPALVARAGGGSTCRHLNLPDGGVFCWWLGLLLGDLCLEVLLALPHLQPARWSRKDS